MVSTSMPGEKLMKRKETEMPQYHSYAPQFLQSNWIKMLLEILIDTVPSNFNSKSASQILPVYQLPDNLLSTESKDFNGCGHTLTYTLTV